MTEKMFRGSLKRGSQRWKAPGETDQGRSGAIRR